jgi:hypothetical protein
MSELNIYQKMLMIQTELETVAKSRTIGKGANSYKAVMESDVLSAIKPMEEKYGVYSYALKREVVYQNCFETKTGDYVKKQFFVRLETTYRFVNTDKPTEYVDTTSYGDGSDPLDKAVGKAMTYADKYALLKGYKIATGDDPDAKSSSRHDEKAAKDYAQSAQRIKTNIVGKLKLECPDEKLLKYATVKTHQELGFNLWSDLDFTQISEIVFLTKFKSNVALGLPKEVK